MLAFPASPIGAPVGAKRGAEEQIMSSQEYPALLHNKGMQMPAKTPAYRNETGNSFMSDFDDNFKGTYEDIDDIFSDDETVVEKPTMKQALLAVFDELNQNYANESFQTQLGKKLSDQCRRTQKKEQPMSHVEGRKELVLKVQKEVLPRHSYPGNKIGAHALMVAAAAYTEDADVVGRLSEMDRLLLQPVGCTLDVARSVAIVDQDDAGSMKRERARTDGILPLEKVTKERHLSDIPKQELDLIDIAAVEEAETPPADNKKEKLLAMADELLTAYDEEQFQEQLHKLIKASAQRKNKPEGERLAHVDGRQELCLSVQRKILPKYGFLGSKLGIYSMFMALEPYCGDSQMLEQMAAMDKVLHMPENTTLRDVANVVAIMNPKL